MERVCENMNSEDPRNENAARSRNEEPENDVRIIGETKEVCKR